MMNKFTLTFKDEQIENNYQEFITNAIRKPLLFQIIINSSAYIIISMIKHLIGKTNLFEDWVQQLVLAIKILMLMTFLIVYSKKPKLIKWVILLFNHVLLIYFYNNTRILNSQEQMFAAQAIVCLQILNIQSGEFFFAIYQIIAFGVFYLIFPFIQYNNINAISIAQVICAILMLSTMFYTNMKALRSQFQFKKIENQWEQIFKAMNKDQYLTFQYNEFQQNFSLNNNDFYETMRNSNDLRNFLRETKIQIGLTLEQFLFDLIQKNKEQKNIINQMQLTMKNRGKQSKLIYSIFYGVQTILLLQIQHESLLQKSQQYSIEKMYQTRFKQLLLKISKILQINRIQQNPHILISQISKHCFHAYLKDHLYFHAQAQLVQFSELLSCRSIIRVLQFLYKNKTITYEQIIQSEIIGCKKIIIFLLMEIIERTLSKEINLKFQIIDDRLLQIKINCIYNQNSMNLSNFVNKYSKIISLVNYDQQCNTYIIFSHFGLIFDISQIEQRMKKDYYFTY